jgi:hypothetical protein
MANLEVLEAGAQRLVDDARVELCLRHGVVQFGCQTEDEREVLRSELEPEGDRRRSRLEECVLPVMHERRCDDARREDLVRRLPGQAGALRQDERFGKCLVEPVYDRVHGKLHRRAGAQRAEVEHA